MMQDINLKNLEVKKLSLPLLKEKNIELSVLRLDKIHPSISGNKWFKLRYYLDEAKLQNKKSIATYGGAWSNHLLATAAICKLNHLHSIGIIRGEEATQLSTTLIKAKEFGMQLFFISRKDYRNKIIPEELNTSEHYFINEGGYGLTGAKGAATILDYCNKETFTHISCAVGTGTMLAGLINQSAVNTSVLGISVLKNNQALNDSVKSLLLDSTSNININHNYPFTGYANYTAELIDFMNDFYQLTGIATDFVYTAKLFYALTDLIKNDYFPEGSKLLAIHSGGLQGNTSLQKGTLIF